MKDLYNIQKILLLVICLWLVKPMPAQEIYPTHWWAGMKNPALQLLLHEKDIADKYDDVQLNYPGVTLISTEKLANKNYLVINLLLSPQVQPGNLTFHLKGKNNPQKLIQYQLKKRSNQNGISRIKGIDASDFIYLIMPDRFSNGDPSNDRVAGMKDQSLNRNEIFLRHGGDLKGIENHLDYLQDLGVTALWLNPVIKNDMPDRTEHGYAFTDHYKVDPRIGGEQAYHSLIDHLHAKGMKIIQDAVYNHVGLEHFLYRDMPDSTWFHRWPVFTQTSYKDQPLIDPYAAEADKKRTTDGWFVQAMPDINQANPYFANFLIQHAIWTTEEYGIDGWRIDTYLYNDLSFMNRCNAALLEEYPQIHLFGETWVHGVVSQSYFTENIYNIPFKSNLPAVTDFQTNLYGILPALNEPFGWTEGVSRLYTTLSQDFVYKYPMKQVIFLDNHDKTRFFSEVGEDFAKYKMGIAWLLTGRGIPQLYYGTEILMKGVANPDGNVRLDFPGGWAGDPQNKFTVGGRTAQENEAFRYVKTLANFRKKSSAICTGNMMQYVPENGVYVYFRYDDKQTVMCVMNTGTEAATLDLSRFSERINGFTKALDVATNTSFVLQPTLTIGGKYLLVMELSK